MLPIESNPPNRLLGIQRLTFWKAFAFWSLALLVVSAITGKSTPHTVPDTPSYTEYDFSAAQQMATEIRSPAYPLVIAVARTVATDQAVAFQWIVWMQIILHAAVVALLMRELRAWGFSLIASLTASGCVAIGCTFWDHVSTIATDCPTMSIGVVTGVLVLRGWRKGFSRHLSLCLGGLILLAIALRPAYLFLLPWALLLVVVRSGDAIPVSLRRRVSDAVVMALVPLLGLFAWCLFRYQSAGDFSLLPFGHQNMAAVTTQLLDNDELETLPGKAGELGSLIGKMRVAVSRGTDVPENLRRSADGLDLRPVSDPALRANSYMTLENRWDAMTYYVVIPAAREVAGDSIVRQHRLLARLDRQIVRSYPLRFVRWWLLAVRRGTWGSIANIVMHPVFFAAIVLFVGGVILRCIRPRSVSALHDEKTTDVNVRWAAFRAFALLAFTYAAANLAFIALTSPTIGRFCDAGFVFIPALAAIHLTSLSASS